MTTTQITITTHYNVTLEQIDKATRIIDMKTNTVFYQVESQTEACQVYSVRYNKDFGCLTCTCKAGQQGIPCWHKRAALAAEQLYKAAIRREHQAECQAIEASEQYQLEQGLVQIEQGLQALEEIFQELDEIVKEADKREQERKDASRTAYLNYCIQLGI